MKAKEQGVKARMLGRQNERNFCYKRLALTSIFCLCFMSVCLIISNCYSLIFFFAKEASFQGKKHLNLDVLICMTSDSDTGLCSRVGASFFLNGIVFAVACEKNKIIK